MSSRGGFCRDSGAEGGWGGGQAGTPGLHHWVGGVADFKLRLSARFLGLSPDLGTAGCSRPLPRFLPNDHLKVSV